MSKCPGLRGTLFALLAAVVSAAAGCDTQVNSAGGGSEPGVVGRNCTVELRPLRVNESDVLHKQRSGRLERLTADWVVVNEGGNEIWIPRDMVLEIRMEKK